VQGVCRNKNLKHRLLHRVNEGFFDTIENHHTDKNHDHHRSRAVGQTQPGRIPRSQESCPESLNDRRDRVDVRHPPPFLRDARDRVDDWCGIHPQAHSKTNQVLQVAIFGGHGRNDDAKAESQPSHQHQKDRQRKRPGREPDRGTAQGKEGEIGKEEGKLDRKSDQVGNDDRDRHHQARKVDLAKQVGIGGEGGGGAGEAAGKVAPQNITRHVEEHLGKTVSWELGDVAEDDRENQRGKQRLDDEPQRTKDGLLVARDKISLHKHANQVAVVPHVTQLQIPPLFSWSDDEIPGIIFSCGLSLVHIV